jgi:hypothetical protein
VCRHLALALDDSVRRQDAAAALQALAKLSTHLRYAEHVAVQADEVLAAGVPAALIATLHLVSEMLLTPRRASQAPPTAVLLRRPRLRY